MKRWMKGATWLLMLLLLRTVCAAADELSIEASVGYDRTIINGRWYPMEVVITGGEEAFSGTVTVDLLVSYDEYDRYEYPVTVAAKETKAVCFAVSSELPQREYEVILRSEEGKVAAQTTTVASKLINNDAVVIGVLSDDTQLAESFKISNSNDSLKRREEWATILLDEMRFARSEKEINAFDLLVIDVFDPQMLSAEQQELLGNWLDEGGILIVGPGSEQANARAWIEAQTGVAFGTKMESSSAYSMLLTCANVPGTAQTLSIYPLDALQAQKWASDAAGQCFFAQTEYGQGAVLICGWDLTAEPILELAQRQAFWQRILLETNAERYEDRIDENRRDFYRYSIGVNESRYVSETISVMPLVGVLIVYVVGAGILLSFLLKKRDRSKDLWIGWPICAVIAFVMVLVWAQFLGLNQPTAASTHVTYYDEDGNVYVEEGASINYADQDRVMISAANGFEVLRKESRAFYENTVEDTLNLRDRVILGDMPSIEFYETAPWLCRNVVVMNDQAPEGTIDALAHMEEDGLHVTIANNTDVDLEDAVLVTSLGYKYIGNIPSGDAQELCIERTDVAIQDGKQLIFDGELLEYPEQAYRVINAYLYPEQELDEAFDSNTLSEAERHRRAIASGEMSMTTTIYGTFSCTLFARTPQLECAQLLKDGEPITRVAQSSILFKDIHFESESESGYFYYFQDHFPAYEVAEVNGKKALGKLTEDRTEYFDIEMEFQYGYDLSFMDREAVDVIRIVGTAKPSKYSTLELEIYDHALNSWVRLDDSAFTELSGDLARRAIDEEGRLFLQYSTSDASRESYVYVPKIIVEGCEQRDLL